MDEHHDSKVGKVVSEFKSGELHSGSKHGPLVTSPAQAKAIALSEAREHGEHVAPKPGPATHGYGHSIGQRSGKLRTSGHPGAHRIGRK